MADFDVVVLGAGPGGYVAAIRASQLGLRAAVEIEFPLAAPARSVKSLASLKGKLTAVVLGKVESWGGGELKN